MTIEKITADNFNYGYFTLLWYEYVNKFHIEPDSWQALFEQLDYNRTHNKIDAYKLSLQGVK